MASTLMRSAYVQAGERSGLAQVGRHDQGVREKTGAVGMETVGRHEGVPARGDEDRVDHKLREAFRRRQRRRPRRRWPD